MEESSNFLIKFDYSIKDIYIRAVRLSLFRKDGSIMPSAFRSRNGVSVTRTSEQFYSMAATFMHSNFEGKMLAVPVMNCKACSVFEEHAPSKNNVNHYNLWGSLVKGPLTPEQVTTLIDGIHSCTLNQKELCGI